MWWAPVLSANTNLLVIFYSRQFVNEGESGSLPSPVRNTYEIIGPVRGVLHALFHTRFPDHFLIERNNFPPSRSQI